MKRLSASSPQSKEVGSWRSASLAISSFAAMSVEDGRLGEEPLHPLMAARGGIERRRERSPLLGSKTDTVAFGQNLARGGEGAIDYELTDRRVACARGLLQDPLGFRRNTNIELV